MSRLLAALALIALALCLLGALALASIAHGLVTLWHEALGDRIGILPNRLLRLNQRTKEAADKLTAATDICLRERF